MGHHWLFTAGSGFGLSTLEPWAAQAAAAVTEAARKAAANFSIVTKISLLIGAFIGAAAGGLGGFDRDAH